MVGEGSSRLVFTDENLTKSKQNDRPKIILLDHFPCPVEYESLPFSLVSCRISYFRYFDYQVYLVPKAGLPATGKLPINLR